MFLWQTGGRTDERKRGDKDGVLEIIVIVMDGKKPVSIAEPI